MYVLYHWNVKVTYEMLEGVPSSPPNPFFLLHHPNGDDGGDGDSGVGVDLYTENKTSQNSNPSFLFIYIFIEKMTLTLVWTGPVPGIKGGNPGGSLCKQK